MYAVDVFTPKEADALARKMVERESRGHGDQANAYDAVAGRCGLSARQLKRFLAGEIKKPWFDLLHGIRVGWINLWEEEIQKMQRELEAQKDRFGGDHFRDLEAEVQALAAKVQAQKERLKI